MAGFVIPYETHQTTSRVWVAWWGKSRRLPLAFRLQNLLKFCKVRNRQGPP
jgi:hypothetical protein